jgi:Bacteriophage replication protein O
MTVQIATTALDPPRAPFRGFRSPNYTPVPDELFDELLTELSGAELKVLLYVIRRTFGFKRDSDTISLSQMLHGIQTRDGRVLDRGVGLSKKTLLEALRSLASQQIIFTQRRQSADKGNEPTAYRLNVLHGQGEPHGRSDPATPLGGLFTPPLEEKVPQGVGHETPPSPRGRNSPTQDSGTQDRVKQETEQHHPQAPAPAADSDSAQGTLAPTASKASRATSAVDVDVLELLLAQGLTRRIASDLATKHPVAVIRQQVEWQRYRPVAKSPAGALVQAIRDAWPAPLAWVEAQEHEAAVARQCEEDARCVAEDEVRRREWEQKPPEERIVGRLHFWIEGRRRKGHEPTEVEVAAKRAELLAGLVAVAAG